MKQTRWLSEFSSLSEYTRLNSVSFAEMKEMFNLFDKNHDRSISVDEMGSALRAMGFRMTNKEVRQAVKKIDTNSK